MSSSPLSSSFRDPSGFLFLQDNTLHRQINLAYRENYDLLLSSGLYENLTRRGLLIPHEEVDLTPPEPEGAYRVIRPESIPFISYPYEWSFSQLQDAALATLAIQKRAIRRGMCLKDASAYNIQFHNGRPVLIDTLSFEAYRQGEPWVAYRQFCQHFLAPLALMSYRDVRLSQLLRVHIDGIPLDLCSSLLPFRSRLRLPIFLHIFQHAAHQKKYAAQDVGHKGGTRRKMTQQAFLALIGNLESGVRGLTWKPAGTEWADYYNATNYTEEALGEKGRLVDDFIEAAASSTVWDLGANTGLFSRLAARRGIPTLAFDIDPAAVERNYLECRRNQEKLIVPLVLDLTNPSPGLGWDHKERMSLSERGPTDTVLALALVHHLAISNNVPLIRLAAFFRKLCRTLIIEFVPKSDSQVRRLLATREDIFPGYTQNGFEKAFSGYFSIEKSVAIPGTDRTLYLMRSGGPG